MCVRKVPSARAGVIFVCNILATIFCEPIVPTPSSMTIRDPKGTHWASYMTTRRGPRDDAISDHPRAFLRYG